LISLNISHDSLVGHAKKSPGSSPAVHTRDAQWTMSIQPGRYLEDSRPVGERHAQGLAARKKKRSNEGMFS
jgi:hypothetical protein